MLAEGSPAPAPASRVSPPGEPRQTPRGRGWGAANPSALCGRSPLVWKTGGSGAGWDATQRRGGQVSEASRLFFALIFFSLSNPPGWHRHRRAMPPRGPELRLPGPSREDAAPRGQGLWAILAARRSVLGPFWGVRGVSRFC